MKIPDKGSTMRVFRNAVAAGKTPEPEFFTLKSGYKAMIAHYTDFTQVNPYSTSNLAQALPPYLSDEEFVLFANFVPKAFTGKLEGLSFAEKHDRALTVEKLFRVTAKNLEVFQKVSSVIRISYTDEMHDGESNNSKGGIVIYGISGEGKTYAVNIALSYFPQVICHVDPQKNHSGAATADVQNLIQVVWLKVICPSRGGPISLCDNIISEVDKLLGTNYSQKFKASLGHRSELDLKIYIERVKQTIKDIHLGILAIDEIQFLAHSESRQQLADFLVELSGEIGVPIIVIGTLEVISAFNQLSFSFKSKLTKYGDVYFEPFQPQAGKAPDEYRALIRVLFKNYQIGRHPISMEDFDHQEKVVANATKQTKALSITDQFFRETGGITQYTINLFILLQQHINQLEYDAQRVANKSQDKGIKIPTPKPIKTTKQLIEKTARQSFKINREYIDAIISGNTKKLQKMKDVDYRSFRLKGIR